MLGISKYSQAYVDDCRVKIDLQISIYEDLVTLARDSISTSEAPLDSAIEAFEVMFFNNMVLVLDHYFCHRLRALEKKDGNPLNETRVLCNSLMTNSSTMAADKTIRLNPSKALLKYQVGDKITLNIEDFRLLSKAFFAEIESKYS